MSHELDIAAIRREYQQRELTKAMVKQDPMQQFEAWFREAVESEVEEVNAMAISTVSPSGQPSTRIVLLKGIDERGFSFFTNYHSKKGQMIAANNQVALTFFWPELERQVRIEGTAEKLSSEENDAYFASRPRGSQLGAWVSDQSEAIDSREDLEKRLVETEKTFENQDVFRPPHWGGYVVIPRLIEFWQGRESRLHDRIEYTRIEQGKWEHHRLMP
ncbi:MAG: pyridoxamine 5'-phosphate oxidase [Bacteroidetes bacterium]|nr:MAG: pyridoxamine 5'-phosphate oxidase [Bacteroidota bacterium]